MVFLRTSMVLIFVLLAPLAASAQWGLPESTAEIATDGALSLFCQPDGNGSPFPEAYVKNGSGGMTVAADATITLTLRDWYSDPVANFPAEDLWLEWSDAQTLHVCQAGTIADAPTDAYGMTAWTHPLQLGGYSESKVLVSINGSILTSNSGFALSVNSPDINFDGIVNLADVGLFAADFASLPVSYRSDLANDGVLNVADVGKLAIGLAAQCQ